MTLTYIRGDLFEAAKSHDKRVLLGHACNCRGFWGAGIAVAFRARYPQAYKQYRDHCRNASRPQDLLGSALLLPTDDNVIVVCLFTSVYGKEPPEVIAQNTAKALEDLRTQIEPTDVLNIPMINSGLFRVPWPLTESELQKSNLNINVYSL